MSYPPLLPAEEVALREFLDLYRASVLEKTADLADAAARTQLLASTKLTIAGVVKHLARMEDLWFTHKFAGREMPDPWSSAPLKAEPDWDFDSASDEPFAKTRDLYEAACARSREVTDAVPLDQESQLTCFGAGRVNLRWVFVHMLEETAAHRGHLDLQLDQARAATG